MGAKAGNMTMRVLPLEKGLLPLEVKAETNAFFSSVRRVSGTATSYVHPRTLRPKRYYEEALQNDVHRVYDVAFRPKRATVDWRFDQRKGRRSCATRARSSTWPARCISRVSCR